VELSAAEELPRQPGSCSAYEVPGLVPGFALHDELQAMAAAGMSKMQVLEGTTPLPCRRLGVDGDRGTVETGRRADLLLPSADPLQSASNTRRIAAVIVGGRYESRPLPPRSLPPEAHEQ
jgi:alpha-D-ribose 1-methylphosphonate 5-triphosphate diphosphatase PhnM